MLFKMVWHNPEAQMTIEMLDFRANTWIEANSYPGELGSSTTQPIATKHKQSNP